MLKGSQPTMGSLQEMTKKEKKQEGEMDRPVDDDDDDDQFSDFQIC